MYNYNNPYYNYNNYNKYIPLAFVSGIEGARNYILPPNSTIYLRDSDRNVIYIKTCNNEGKYTLKSFEMVEIDQDIAPSANNVKFKEFEANNYITRDEFENFKKELRKEGNYATDTIINATNGE